jgi:Mrp family chromosome partitioning ATPase
MSISDQAFIRAYDEDAIFVGAAPPSAIDIGLGSVIPAPHAKFPPMEMPSTPAPAAPPTTSGIHAAKSSLLKTDGAGGMAAPHIGSGKPHWSFGQSPKVSLSSFVGLNVAATPAAEPHKPALEVDAVRWPAVCETLLARHAERFDRLAAEIRHEVESGHKVTAISGIRRGEGRTTLALCLARRLAAGNTKIALVDADFSNPSLAAQLSIAIEQGWEAALDGEATMWESMIESVADRFAIAPLAANVAKHDITPAAFRIAAVLGELAEHYDVVLLDAGPIGAESVTTGWLLEPSVGVHNIILAHDVRRPESHRLAAGCLQIAEAKQRQLGIAETFVAPNT